MTAVQSAQSQSQIELARLDADDVAVQDYSELPPVDRGRAAWTFLAACFVIEALTWGFPFAFGVFQVYYNTLDQFAGQTSGIAAIGTTCTGIMYFLGPAIAFFLQRFPRARQPLMWSGLLLIIISLLASSFCDHLATLLLTQGVLYALGGTCLYYPVMQLVDEWFIARKGLAYGCMWGGTGVAGIVVPFLLQHLLTTYGHKTALRVWAIAVTVLAAPCMPFLRPRLPPAARGAFRPSDWRFLGRRTFWLFQAGNVAQSFGSFLPGLYIPSFADSLGFPAYTGPLALALYNVAFCVGSIGLGAVVDRFHVTVGILISTVGSLFAIFVFWGLAESQAMLFAFAVLSGMFGGSFSVTWSGCAAVLRRSEKSLNIDAGLVISLLAAGKGIGAVISGPLSAALLETNAWRGQAQFAYGSGYGPLVVLSGVSAALGGTAWVGRQFRLI